MKTKLIISGLALLAVTTLGSAQNYGGQPVQQNSADECTLFVDANNDGVCDNINSNEMRGTGRKANGNFQGNNNAAGKGQHAQQGMQGQRGQQGQAKEINFVDADKNGVCDLYETPTTN